MLHGLTELLRRDTYAYWPTPVQADVYTQTFKAANKKKLFFFSADAPKKNVNEF